MIVGRVVRGENLRFFWVCVHVCCFAGVSEVLIKYTGKYVNIYFNMKITYFNSGTVSCPSGLFICLPSAGYQSGSARV